MKIVSALTLREVAHALSCRYGKDNPAYNQALLDLIKHTVGDAGYNEEAIVEKTD